jgi:two-component sensor histidine kinase
MKNLLAIIMLLSFFTSLRAQHNKIDSLEHLLTVANDTTKVNVLNKLAGDYQFCDMNKSLVYSERARALAEKIHYQKGLAMALCISGEFYSYKGESQKALEHYKLSLKTLGPTDKPSIVTLLTRIFINISDSTLKIHYFNKALKISEEMKFNAGNLYYNIGNNYYGQAHYETAIHYYLKGLDQGEKFDDKLTIMINLDGIGSVLAEQDNERAIEYKSRALALAKELNNTEYKAWIKSYYITYYLKKNNYDSAIIIGNEVKHIALQHKDYFTTSNALSEMGYAFQLKGNSLKAIQCYRDALTHLSDLAMGQRLQVILLTRTGEAYSSLKKHKEAIPYLQEAIARGKKLNFKNELIPAYKTLSEAYFNTTDYLQAHRYNQSYHALKDSIYSLEKIKKIASANATYEIDKKEQAIKMLEQNNSIKDLEISRRRIQFILVIGLCLFLIVVAFLVYNRYRLKVKAHAEIMNYAKEKEILLQEIHHRVKNNLQLISSLLNWQTESIKDSHLLQIIDEGRSRIKSMALIHESLYQSNNMAHIDIKTYIDNLVGYLNSIYNRDNSIYINKNIQPVLFDVDIIVPIGLIVTELISNSFKYAFPFKTEGVIDISLAKTDRGVFILQVKDNGIGLSEELLGNAVQTQTMGMELVRLLVKQIKGKLQISNDSGSNFAISFSSISKELVLC